MDQQAEEDDIDVPEEIEDILGELFNALQDRVSINHLYVILYR